MPKMALHASNRDLLFRGPKVCVCVCGGGGECLWAIAHPVHHLKRHCVIVKVN